MSTSSTDYENNQMMTNSIEVVVTRRNKPMLLFAGYRYHVKRKSNNMKVISWRCANRTCSSTMTTTNTYAFIGRNGMHSCVPLTEDDKIAKSIKRARKESLDENTDSQQSDITNINDSNLNCVLDEVETSVTLDENLESVLNHQEHIDKPNIDCNDEEASLKLELLKFELETKRREANINYEINMLRKKVQLEELYNKKKLMKLQQENELLRNKLLKMEFAKARKWFRNNISQNNSEDVLINEDVS